MTAITCPTCGTQIIPAVQTITEGQQRAYHAKINARANAAGTDRATIKGATLAAASEQFGRELTSSSELTSAEASWVLDLLDKQLEPAT